MSLLFFQASVPLFSAAKARGLALLSLAPQQRCPTAPRSRVPLLDVQACSCCFHDLASCPAPALKVQPLLHPQDKLGSHHQGSERDAEPAAGGGRLSVQACAAWGLGQIPRHGLRGVQERASGVGVRVTGHPCYSRTRPSSCVLCATGDMGHCWPAGSGDIEGFGGPPLSSLLPKLLDVVKALNLQMPWFPVSLDSRPGASLEPS